ncbi:MAG TPA: lysylphosphatidylglycerol synthase domain-containing protein [Casimicrobiaceae bacterium]|jgi:putative membrane protein|nr:lysylphosphatidylglycerol synthase domain-containing protein [Casimicrobiaceae bacterium]
MKRVARVLAIVGLAVAAALFARQNVAQIAHLVGSAIPGLMLAAAFHALPMVTNAIAWRRLFPRADRPPLAFVLRVVWIRESVNGVLPVARVGGEIAAYRVLRKHVSSRAAVAASLAADVALSVLSQAAFALLGISLLLASGHGGRFARELAFGVAAMLLAGGAFLLAQRKGALTGAAALIERLFSGKLRSARARSLRVDRALRDVHARHADVVACVVLQFVAWVLSAGETWLALHFLGHPVSIAEAIAIEASVQAANSVAFAVPAAVGVQEGAFIVIGSVVGLDATTALALAAARRLRDLVIFLPGLVAWHRSE